MAAPPLSVSASSWRSGARVIVRGRRWQINHTSAGEDCVLLRLNSIDDRKVLSILTPFDRPRTIDRHGGVRIVRPRRWLHDLDRAVLNLQPFGTLAAAARSSIRVLPYQLEPALALLTGRANRILIADAVGLGKMIQAGLIVRELARDADAFRAIVLVPAGLREQWASELSDRFSLDCVRADASWLRGTQSMLPSNVNPWSLPGLYIASHDFVKRPESLKPLEQVTWHLVVVDEAHAATSSTDRRAALDAIASRSDRIVLLTATPHQGDPAEFAALCRIGRIDVSEGPILMFARSQADVGAARPRRTVVLPVTCSEAELRMHGLLERYSVRLWSEATARGDESARLVSIILRKRALSSAASLAASIHRRLDLLSGALTGDAQQLRLPLADEDPLADDEPSEGLGVPGLADSRRERQWLRAIAEAARAAARAETKLGRLLRLFDRVSEPVIVFTEYRDTLVRLQRHIAATGRAVAVLHGGLSPAERSRVPQLLRKDGMVLLATDAASEGLNLHQHCRIVVHYELPWHPMRLEQRAGRVDRIGQAKRVHEIALVASTTAERLVVAPLILRATRKSAVGPSPSAAAALNESRVAEAVLGGTLRTRDVRDTPDTNDEEIHVVNLRGEAQAEAARIEQQRALTARSGAFFGRVRTDRAVATVVVDGRHDGSTNAVALLYSIDLEDGDGRHVHSETVTLRIDRTREVLSSDRLRELASAFDDPATHELLAPLQSAIKSAIARLEPLLGAVRGRMQQRRHLIMRARRSAAQTLVQPGLFGRRTQGSSVALHEPVLLLPETSLKPRVSLLAVVATVHR